MRRCLFHYAADLPCQIVLCLGAILLTLCGLVLTAVIRLKYCRGPGSRTQWLRLKPASSARCGAVATGHCRGTWAWDTDAHASCRIDNPNSIAKAEIDCEIAHLDGLLPHKPTFLCAAMQDLIAVSTRRGRGLEFVNGTDAQFAAVRRLAWKRLAPAFRTGYRSFAFAPALARFLLQKKKRALLISGQ